MDTLFSMLAKSNPAALDAQCHPHTLGAHGERQTAAGRDRALARGVPQARHPQGQAGRVRRRRRPARQVRVAGQVLGRGGRRPGLLRRHLRLGQRATCLYDNAEVTGWHSGYPDAHAQRRSVHLPLIPWEQGTAAFLLDFVAGSAARRSGVPAALLKRVLSGARHGFRVKSGREYEFFLFTETPESLREKGYSNLDAAQPGMFGYSWLRASRKRRSCTRS